jgi:hypothetical protein
LSKYFCLISRALCPTEEAVTELQDVQQTWLSSVQQISQNIPPMATFFADFDEVETPLT